MTHRDAENPLGSHKSDEFFAIDFDRVLGNTPELYNLFLEVLKESGNLHTVVALENAYQHAVESGTSFSVTSFIHQQNMIDEDVLAMLGDDFVTKAEHLQDTLSMEGAHEFIEHLRQEGIPHGILSYGDKSWQEMKIQASGFGDVPRMIIDHKQKARQAAEWFDGQKFHIPRQLTVGRQLLAVSRVVVIDDKQVAFEDMPVNMQGYLVNPDVHTAKLVEGSEEKKLPIGVTAVSSLRNVIYAEMAMSRSLGDEVVLT